MEHCKASSDSPAHCSTNWAVCLSACYDQASGRTPLLLSPTQVHTPDERSLLSCMMMYRAVCDLPQWSDVCKACFAACNDAQIIIWRLYYCNTSMMYMHDTCANLGGGTINWTWQAKRTMWPELLLLSYEQWHLNGGLSLFWSASQTSQESTVCKNAMKSTVLLYIAGCDQGLANLSWLITWVTVCQAEGKVPVKRL